MCNAMKNMLSLCANMSPYVWMQDNLKIQSSEMLAPEYVHIHLTRYYQTIHNIQFDFNLWNSSVPGFVELFCKKWLNSVGNYIYPLAASTSDS